MKGVNIGNVTKLSYVPLFKDSLLALSNGKDLIKVVLRLNESGKNGECQKTKL